MSFRVIRVLLCDCEGCETPSPYVLMGEDDQAAKDGWVESVTDGKKLHSCPACVAAGKIPTKLVDLYALA
jgi:hypothetical protein